MKNPVLPVVATWLLKHFVDNEALAGDLVEEYRSGRSALWYWKQVLSGIVVTTASQLRTHKVLAVRAILLGWAVSYVTAHLIFGFPAPFDYYIPWNLGRFLPHLFSGSFWNFSYFYMFLPSLVFMPSGWVVARLHRPNMAMALAWAASVPIFALPELYRLADDASTNSRFLPYLYRAVIYVGVEVASTLVGSLLGASRIGRLSES